MKFCFILEFQNKSNMCELRRDSCVKQELIELGYEGVCDKCKTKFCPFYSYCIDDGREAKCVCPTSCKDVSCTIFLYTNIYRSGVRNF